MSLTASPTLALADLANGIHNLHAVRGAVFCQAGAVCLDAQGHVSGVPMQVDGNFAEAFSVTFPDVTDQMRKSWRDSIEATYNGATGIAILLVRMLTGFTVIKQSVIGSGFDWLLGPETTDEEGIFQTTVRLEISGILRGDETKIRKRVKEKLHQTEQSDSWDVPAYVVVVEFSEPRSRVVQK